MVSALYSFILEKQRSACQAAAYAYKVVCFFIKDYTNKALLRGGSKDDAEEPVVTHP